MLTRLAYRINASLERHLPEQRLFLKSDTETRFIRLRPATQAIALIGGTFLLAWIKIRPALDCYYFITHCITFIISKAVAIYQ